MKRALIGHTGYVGGSLLAEITFTHTFNSHNFGEMRGMHFDEIVCAGVSSLKWLANREPERDLAAIRDLLTVLGETRADRFVLISTVDVYPDPSLPLDESADLAGLANNPYGSHRLRVERFVADHFPTHSIVRLPALFGRGLKKNALFDLLNHNMVDKINPAAVFQWYPTPRLVSDLTLVAKAGLKLANLVTEPIAMRDIIARFFSDAAVGPETEPVPRYGLHTRQAAVFGGTLPWIMPAHEVLLAMEEFVNQVRRG